MEAAASQVGSRAGPGWTSLRGCGGFIRWTRSSHAQQDSAPAPLVEGDRGELEMFRMTDQNGFAISRPRAINLKTVLSLFDFNRKKRLLSK